MSNKYADYIRLIVGVKPNQSSLGPAPVAQDLPGFRGFGYYNQDGTVGSATGQPGNTTAFNLLGGTLNSSSVPPDQQKISNIKNNYTDIKNVFNQHIGDQLNGITNLKDCVTGKAVDLRTNDQFVPPTNWDNVTTPSITNPLRWDLGSRWVAPTTPPTYGESADDVAHAAVANLAGATWTFTGYIAPSSIGSTAPFAGHYSGTPGSLSANLEYDKVACVVGTDAFCPATGPLIPWPADGKMQLARKDGKFIVSPNENAADIAPMLADNMHSKLDLCFNDGSGRKASVEQTYDGGFMVYETNPSTGDPKGQLQIYNSDNVLTDSQTLSSDIPTAHSQVDYYRGL